MAEREIDGDARHQLEPGQGVAGGDPQTIQKRDCGCRIGHADKGGFGLARTGKQFQNRCGDDAQRPLPADEQMLQIVSGIVLVQTPQPIPYPPIRQNSLDAQNQLAHIAVTYGHGAAGIGGQQSADCGTALRPQA
jgi:hypothetical protein